MKKKNAARRWTALPVLIALVALLAAAPAPAQEKAPTVPPTYTGKPMTVTLSSTLTSAPYALLVSAQPGPTPTPYGSLGVGVPFLLLATGTTDSQGGATVKVTLPPDPHLAGATFHLAAVYLDLNRPTPTVAFSAGAQVTVNGPVVIAACEYIRMIASAKICLIDPIRGKLLGQFNLPYNPSDIAVDPQGAYAYVTAGKEVRVVDIPGRKEHTFIGTPAARNLEQIQPAADGRHYFLLNPGFRYGTPPIAGEVIRLDSLQGKTTTVVTLPGPAEHLIPTSHPARAWVTNPLTRDVWLVDMVQAKVIKTVRAGRTLDTELFAADKAGTNLLVTTGDRSATSVSAAGSLTLIDANGAIVGVIPTMNPLPMCMTALQVGAGWQALAACSWTSSSVNTSFKLYDTGPLKLLGDTTPNPSANPTAMLQVGALPRAAVLWSGNPGYPNTSMARAGELAIIDATNNKVMHSLKLDRQYQGAFHHTTNPTLPALLYVERNDPTQGGDLRIFDLTTMKLRPTKVVLGQVVTDLADV